jgi:hypothetical protein
MIAALLPLVVGCVVAAELTGCVRVVAALVGIAGAAIAYLVVRVFIAGRSDHGNAVACAGRVTGAVCRPHKARVASALCFLTSSLALEGLRLPAGGAGSITVSPPQSIGSVRPARRGTGPPQQ